jgi:hypothetical protein
LSRSADPFGAGGGPFLNQIGMIRKVPSSIDAIELSMLHGVGS